MRYEGYAPGGVAVIVEALTDNRNRTAGEVRSYFTKAGGSLAETGAVSFMFDRVGSIVFDRKVAERRGDARGGDRGRRRRRRVRAGGARGDHLGRGACATRRRRSRRNSASRAKAALVWRPQNTVAVDDEAGEKILRLIGALEDNDDVQNVTANFEVSEALVAKMEA